MPKSFFGTTRSVGLDIGFNTIKIVELKNSLGKISVTGSNLVGIPAGAVNKNGINHKDVLAKAIIDATRRSQPSPISQRVINTALPESLIFSKIISLSPEIKPKEIEENVLVEVAELLPWPIAESYIDWQTLPKQTNKKDEPYTIYIVAALRKLVDDFMEVISMAKFELGTIETKPIATCRALVEKHETSTIMLCDIGAEHSSASIIKKGIIRFSSTISIGANASYYTYKGMEKYLMKTPKVEQTAIPLVDNILNNIKYYKTRISSKDPITEIRLSGGGSNLPDIEKIIFEKTKIPTVIGNASVNFNDKSLYDPQALQIFTVSIGLALREMLK